MVLLVDAIANQGVLNLQIQTPHPALLQLFYQAIGFILVL